MENSLKRISEALREIYEPVMYDIMHPYPEFVYYSPDKDELCIWESWLMASSDEVLIGLV